MGIIFSIALWAVAFLVVRRWRVIARALAVAEHPFLGGVDWVAVRELRPKSFLWSLFSVAAVTCAAQLTYYTAQSYGFIDWLMYRPK